MGEGDDEPRPTFVVIVDGSVVGWVDYDRDQREWLTHDEVNIGYGLHPDARGHGYATRAVRLMLRHLAEATDVQTATLLIHPDNETSLAIPRRCGFVDHGTLGDNQSRYFKRAVLRSFTDGVIVLRPPTPADRDALIGLRDEQFRQFIGEGSPDPRPTFCVVVADAVVGWVDAEHVDDQHWLAPNEANVGYALHPDHRGLGHATRAVQLLLSHLAHTQQWSVATLAIDFDNQRSLAIAERCEFEPHGTIVGDKEARFFKRSVPPLSYSDGVVTIRAPRPDDAERHLEATDDVQIHWLWPQEHRDDWATKSADERLDHQRRFLTRTATDWGTGPQWWFVIEAGGQYVGHVDANLANPDVQHGDANISYSMHPDHRGKGYVSRAVRLALTFVRDHTGAGEAHIVVDPANEASMRVAAAVHATERERIVDSHGTTMVRHVISLR